MRQLRYKMAYGFEKMRTAAIFWKERRPLFSFMDKIDKMLQ